MVLFYANERLFLCVRPYSMLQGASSGIQRKLKTTKDMYNNNDYQVICLLFQ